MVGSVLRPRLGLNRIYGNDCRNSIKLYKEDYNKLLDDPNVEAVIIALPLHLHAEAAIAARSAYGLIHPETPLHFEYSTTSGIPTV